jgi:bifunctional DNase/RNase
VTGDALDAVEPADPVEPVPAEAPVGEPPASSPVFRVMQLSDVSLDLPSHYPVVTLDEAEEPFRHLTFPVGLHEGTNLAHAYRRVATARPLSHEVLAEVLARFQIDVVAVRLVGRERGTYLAELDLIGSRGREIVPCRPTDGLNLVLRLPVPPPILCDERLLENDEDVEPG